jgi:hypothetical protein
VETCPPLHKRHYGRDLVRKSESIRMAVEIADQSDLSIDGQLIFGDRRIDAPEVCRTTKQSVLSKCA